MQNQADLENTGAIPSTNLENNNIKLKLKSLFVYREVSNLIMYYPVHGGPSLAFEHFILPLLSYTRLRFFVPNVSDTKDTNIQRELVNWNSLTHLWNTFVLDRTVILW